MIWPRGMPRASKLDTICVVNADRINLSWDTDKKKWLVRIQVGEAVIRRYCDEPKNADDQALRSAAEKTVVDEGYRMGQADISVAR